MDMRLCISINTFVMFGLSYVWNSRAVGNLG